jgi:hypothetical protein
VRFDGYGEYSLNIAIRVYVKTSSYYEFFAVRNRSKTNYTFHVLNPFASTT